MCWCELSVIIPLYFEEKDLLKCVGEFCTQPHVFLLSDPKLYMHKGKSVGLRWTLLSLAPPPHLECHSSSREQKTRSLLPIRQQASPLPAPAQVRFSKGSRLFWHVLEEAVKKRSGPCPVQGGVEQPEEEWQRSASHWHAPSSGKPWQDWLQSRCIEFPNFVVPFMSLFYFFLYQS